MLVEEVKHIAEQKVTGLYADAELNSQFDSYHISAVTHEDLLGHIRSHAQFLT